MVIAGAPTRLKATLAVDSRCVLGESILWCERRQELFWVDIEARQLWRHVPANGTTRQWTLPDRVGCIAFAQDERLLIGLANGLYALERAALERAALEAGSALELHLLCPVEADNPDTRINDGRADREGRFVFGTKSERADQARVGRFHQYSAEHGLRELALPPTSIPNSICFDSTGTLIHFCDSLDPRILCAEYDSASARVDNIRTFVELDDPAASPDGSCMDREGALWNAQWGAGRVVRYWPDGSVDRIVTVPTQQVSCCALGGPAGNRLYTSSARIDLDDAALVASPHAGGVFATPLEASLARAEDRVRLP